MIRDSGKHRGEPTRFLVVTALSGMGVSLRGQLRNVKQAADAHVEALIPLACSIGGAVGCTLALGAPNEWLLPLLVPAVTFSWLAYVTWPIAMRLVDRLSVMWIKWRHAKSPRNGPALHDLMAFARTQSASADMLGGLIAHFAREDAIRSLGRVDYHKNAMPVSATRASSLGRGSEPSGSRPKSPRRASQRARPRRSSSGWCRRCGAPNVEPGRTAPFAGR